MKKIIALVALIVALIILVLIIVPKKTNPTPSVQTHSIRDISFSVPSDFGLAVTPEQILVKSYIPPCDQNFDYCLYYLGKKYEGTNFESAGLRIKIRTDLTTKEGCNIAEKTGDAGAGHFATGDLYRLFINQSCYEFETRIGKTNFDNYPTGAIKEFTVANQAEMEAELRNLLDSITTGGQKIIFPYPLERVSTVL